MSKDTEEQRTFFKKEGPDGLQDLQSLAKRTAQYREILANTESYRKIWKENLKATIQTVLLEMNDVVGLGGEIELHDRMDNLEAIQFTLGTTMSGMKEEVAKNVHRSLIKHNGSLVYQQLFNGKIMVVINYPYIEGYGQPAPPKTVAIYRPEELKLPYLIRHMEEFVQELSKWEDLDDDQPTEVNQAIGFRLNFNGDAETPTDAK